MSSSDGFSSGCPSSASAFPTPSPTPPFPAGDQGQVLALLLGAAAADGEEECRNVVAECLGRLALLHPAPVLTALQARVAAPSALVRAVVSGG